MRKIIFPLMASLAAVVVAGCAGPEAKLGRGIDNTYEVVRLGELRRSVEQAAVFDSPSAGYTGGVITGFDRSVARTGIGLYEIITFPFPPYHPVATSYLTPKPAFPESDRHGLMADPLFSTDMYAGYSGGLVFPWTPGSRFTVFDN